MKYELIGWTAFFMMILGPGICMLKINEIIQNRRNRS